MLTELVGSCASETLDAYVRGLRGVFGDGLAGHYLYGSVACGAYDPAVSDVDVAVLHRSGLSGERRRVLARLHEHFGSRYAASARFDVSFVPLRLVGTYGENNLPYYRAGCFCPIGGGDVNPVMWHTLRTGEISGKASAARWALGEVDLRWRPLIERALTRYEGDDLSGSDPLLEKEAEAFALHLRNATE